MIETLGLIFLAILIVIVQSFMTSTVKALMHVELAIPMLYRIIAGSIDAIAIILIWELCIKPLLAKG